MARRDITEILREVEEAKDGAEDELLECLHEELRTLAGGAMRGERVGHTLQTTVLVNEAWLSLMGDSPAPSFENRAHFLGAASRAMRRTLIHYARRRSAGKRGGGIPRQELVEVPDMPPLELADVLAVHESLEQLAQEEPRAAEVVELRFFGGAELADVANALGVSESTVQRDWRFARAWLLANLGEA